MPLMADETAKAAGKELIKIKGKPKGRRYFMLGIKGSQGFLDIGKRRFKANQLKDLKKRDGCQIVIHGHIEWGADEGTYIFRSRQASRATGKWKTIKKDIAKADAPQFKTAEFKSALLSGTDEAAAVTMETTDDRVLKSLDEYLLNQQSMMRDDKGLVNGIFSPEQLGFRDAEGEPLVIDAELLRAAGLDRVFSILPDGSLQLLPPLLVEGHISPESRSALSAALLGAVKKGFDLSLSNNASGEKAASMELHAEDGGHLEQTVAHKAAASPTNLHYDRDNEVIPGASPPITFREAFDLMASPDCSDEEFRFLNSAIKDAFELEIEQGSVSPDMTFMQYKMQFVAVDVENVDERGLRWHDGDGHLNAAEWAFLDLKVNDLPDEEQFYCWVTIKFPDGNSTTDQMAFPKEPKSKAEGLEILKQYAKDNNWRDDLELEYHRFAYHLPGKKTVQPKVRALPKGSMRCLLADTEGDVLDEMGAPIDFSQLGYVHPEATEEERQQKELLDRMVMDNLLETSVSAIKDTVMDQAIHTWVENSGESIGDLLKPIPDTRKVFLRQSNGTDNADTVDGTDIGQTDIVRRGNDTGAFGKCAPTAHFCGAICGIAKSTRKGLDALTADPITAAGAKRLEKLLTAKPMNEEARAAIDAQLVALSDSIQAAWQAFHATSPPPTPEQIEAKKASLIGLLNNIDATAQMKKSIIDRMVPKKDVIGPYFDMKFPVPRGVFRELMQKYNPKFYSDLPPEFHYDAKEDQLYVDVKVRPEDIQEYLEQTNRADAYRGGKQHMMDFFKDPSALNNIELMKTLGPGLIAVGLDKGLKLIGKDSGLLYGPGADVVSTMVYGKPTGQVGSSFNDELGVPLPGEDGFDQAKFDEKVKERRDQILSTLRTATDSGGGMSVVMGYNPANYHVNYIQDWGTPTIDGVAISSDDIARCHMNYAENAATSSAWNNDRVQSSKINTGQMSRGLSGILGKLGEDHPEAATLKALIAEADAATAMLAKMSKRYGYASLSEWKDKAQKWRRDQERWIQAQSSPEYLTAVRKVSADTMAWIKSNMTMDSSPDTMDPDNVVIMPSNTERDNSSSDNATDRRTVGGGEIGSQEYGSANASDASYFVPLKALASGWNGKYTDDKKEANDSTSYNYKPDPDDQFIMLSSLVGMVR
jgi:hypothetical protein